MNRVEANAGKQGMMSRKASGERGVKVTEHHEALGVFIFEQRRTSMTYAEKSKSTKTRDDEHMIFEMFNISQYKDGSVLDCLTMRTFTAAEVVEGDVIGCVDCSPASRSKVYAALSINAKAAIKNGITENLAPMCEPGKFV
jgi:hypothetical protein